MRCACCLREERWEQDHVEVLVMGGKRKPGAHPELTAWITLRAALTQQTGPVVGQCPGCGQPLVSDGTGPSIDWKIAIPGGHFTLADGVLSGPRGEPVSVDQAHDQIYGAYRDKVDVAQGLFSGALLTVMGVPIALWMFTFFIVVWFLFNIFRGGVGLVP